jgi:hypothetical protein
LEDATTATPTPEPEARPKRRRAAVSSLSVLFQDDMDEDTVGVFVTLRYTVLSETSM